MKSIEKYKLLIYLDKIKKNLEMKNIDLYDFI